jgi:hypothetical protein
MRKTQVTISIERVGNQVPKGYPKNSQRTHVYADSNNVYEALSKAYAETINLLGEYENIPAFGRCDCSTNADGSIYGNMLGKWPKRSEYYDEGLEELNDTIFYIEHAEEIIGIIKLSEDLDEARASMMSQYDIPVHKANNMLRLRFGMFTKQELAEIKNKRDEYQRVIEEKERMKEQ